MNDKNHNDLSIPYKVPHFVCLEEGMEQGKERGVALSRENANGSYHIWVSGGNACLNRINCNEKIDVTVQVDS